jgi:hypothetical protein
VRGWNLLVTGESGSGKSWVTGLVAEQAILAHYSVCVVDPEGDYAALENLPGVTVLGHDGPPTLREVERALQYPDVSVVVDLSAMPRDDRLAYVPSLLTVLASARRRRGFPHRIIVDEAHYFLDRPEALELLDLELASYTLTTYNMARLDPRILYATDAIIVTKQSDPTEARALMSVAGFVEDDERWRATLAGLAVNEAVLVTMVGPGPGADATLPARPPAHAARPAPSQVHGHARGREGRLRLHAARRADGIGAPHARGVLRRPGQLSAGRGRRASAAPRFLALDRRRLP